MDPRKNPRIQPSRLNGLQQFVVRIPPARFLDIPERLFSLKRFQGNGGSWVRQIATKSQPVLDFAGKSPTSRVVFMKLKNQTVVVIGGSSGMGMGVSEALAAEGAKVIVASRTLEKCQQAASKIGGLTEGRSIDMNSEENVRSFFETIGEIHHLIIPGSAVKTGPFKTTSTEDLMDSMRSKFLGPLLCARYARFNENASLTFFSGSLSRKPGNSSLLGAINAAVETLAKGLAIELAPVRVNVISPGLTRDTNAFNAMPEAAREQMFSGYAKKLPVGRVGLPKDFGQTAVFLTTCNFVTGSIIDVDGGGLLV